MPGVRHPFRLPVLSVLTAALLGPTVAVADSTTESQFVSDTNSARAHNGLPAYAVAGDLTSVARRWAAHMASTHTLAHNPDYGSQVCCWRSVGENVGEGPSEPQIQQAFMASAPHRDNILSGVFTQVGIGTARDSDGRLYVDELFRRPDGSYAAPSPAAAPAAPVVHAVRSTPARVSRSVVRPARVSAAAARAAAAVLARHQLAVRLAAARRVAVPQPDPVGGALTFVRVMGVVTGSAR